MKFLKVIAITLICISVLMFSSCKNNVSEPSEQTIYYSVTDEPVTLDPQIANDAPARLVIMNTFEGLVKLDGENNPVSGVADKWENNLTNTEYIFHLRENARWQDGSPLTAEDFLYGFQRTFMPQTGSETAKTLFCIKNAEKIRTGKLDVSSLGVSVQDEHTLKIELEYAEPQFLFLLTTPPAMPCKKSFFESTGGQYGLEDNKILSNGAFYVGEHGWKHDQWIHLVKNGNYIGEVSPIPQGVNIKIADSPENVCTAILNQKVDCYALDINELQQAEKNQFHLTAFGDTVWGIAFNLQNEIFQNTDIRVALLRSLDRERILQDLPEGCTAVSDIVPDTAKTDHLVYRSFVGDGLGIRFSENAKEDFQKALENLSSAEDDEYDDYYDYDDEETIEFPNLNILCTDEAATRSVVNNIIAAWNQLTGKYANKTPVSRSELNQKIVSGDYEIVIAPLRPDGENPVDMLKLFSGDSAYNIAKLADKDYDTLIAQIRQAPDSSGIDKMVQAEKYLNNRGIFYPLYTENRYYASAKNVTDIIFHPYGAEADFSVAKKTKK